MDDSLDDPVRIVRDMVECRLRFVQGEVMGRERINDDRPAGNEVDGRLRAVVLPTYIQQAQLLSP